jgi:hypothetical protein
MSTYVESGVLVCVVCAKRVEEEDLGEINRHQVQICKKCLGQETKAKK